VRAGSSTERDRDSHLTQHLGRLGPLDGQLGEGLVHLGGGPQLGDLGVDHAGVHGFGDRDEAGLPVQGHERQPASLRGSHERGRQRTVVPPSELDDQPRDAHVV